LKLLVVAVGKIKERGIREAVDDYAARLRRYTSFDEIELRDGDAAEVAARFRRALPERARVVALEVDGQAWSSERLARLLGECEVHSVPALAFLIGGSYGLPPALSRAADVRLSLSAMTLPHRLARLVLCEQLYRGFTILRGEPYSH
jgi:23S rRNA (pseudouridine1915-N3)-methyltransferase